MVYLDTVFAIQDFEAENEDEIGFLKGEPIIVLQKDDGFHDGWWKGQNIKNEIGLFPMTYTSESINSLGKTKSCFSDISTLRPSSVCSNQILKKSVMRTLCLPRLKWTSPEEWDIDQVQIWLHEMQFDSNILAHFEAQEITGDVLLELTMDSLKELGIVTFGKRFRLYTAIQLLREEYDDDGDDDMSVNRISMVYSSTSEGSIDQGNRFGSVQSYSSTHPSLTSFVYQPKPLTKTSMDGYDPKECMDIGPDTKGWLYKQGCKYKQWNRRWFVLKGVHLFYFKNPEDMRMRGIINLKGYRIIPDETIQPGKYSFKAQHFEERTFYFYTDTEASMRQWISPLIKATISRDFSAPVLSSHTIPTVSLGIARRMKPRPPSILLYKQPNRMYLEYIQWVNSRLPQVHLGDLQELRTGHVLLQLVQELSGRQLRHCLGRSLEVVFEFLSLEQGFFQQPCPMEDIEQGNRDQILLLLQRLRQWFMGHQDVNGIF